MELQTWRRPDGKRGLPPWLEVVCALLTGLVIVLLGFDASFAVLAFFIVIVWLNTLTLKD